MAGNSTTSTNLDRELLESIHRKLSESKALNGGFERLVLMIEHIKEKQEDAGEKLDSVSSALYQPETGLFARVKDLDTKMATNSKDMERMIRNNDEAIGELSRASHQPDPLRTELHDLKQFKQSINEICGNQLHELAEVVKLRKGLSKLYWSLGAAIAATIGKLAFDTIKNGL